MKNNKENKLQITYKITLMIIYLSIYIYIYKKSKKTTSYFHRTFRIALNSFSRGSEFLYLR